MKEKIKLIDESLDVMDSVGDDESESQPWRGLWVTTKSSILLGGEKDRLISAFLQLTTESLLLSCSIEAQLDRESDPAGDPDPLDDSLTNTDRVLERHGASQALRNYFSVEKRKWDDCDDADRERLSDQAWATLSDQLLLPFASSWAKARQYISNAVEDAEVKKSDLAVQFLERIDVLIKRALEGASTMESLFQPVNEEFKRSQAARNASMKNKSAREWVQSEWAAQTKEWKSKKTFAHSYVDIVKQKYKLDVTADTIARNWIPKDK